MQKRGLGKGLSALIPEMGAIAEKEEVVQIDVQNIVPNRYQPREEFDRTKLNELIESIKEQGIIQPVLVRRKGEGYELIAGERRWRAVKELGMDKIPALIKDAGEDQSLAISLIENIQREDLNPIEEAKAYQRLIEEFSLTQEEIALKVGKDRATIANILRLLKLSAGVQEDVSRGTISMGHARAILALEDTKKQVELARTVVSKGLSVRETENLVNRLRTLKTKQARPRIDPHLRAIEEELQRLFGTRVRIIHGKKRGHIRIEYYRPEDLERILNILEIRPSF